MQKKIITNFLGANFIGLVKFALIGFLAILALMLIANRYITLKNQVLITRFFQNARYVLTPFSSQMESLSAEDYVAKWSNLNQPLLDYARSELPKKADKYYRDPFSDYLSQRFLPLRVGVVKHQHPAQNQYYKSNQPVVFAWSNGPSRIPPAFNRENEGIHNYRFISPMYNVSNGLFSYGYLYVDTQGGIWGKVD